MPLDGPDFVIGKGFAWLALTVGLIRDDDADERVDHCQFKFPYRGGSDRADLFQITLDRGRPVALWAFAPFGLAPV